ncbi:MAG: PLP-dependent aminotransferase family protein [Verrucomicrobia bacterium]|nr:PLP-dependent aminotransferase family protein [Verrucomicrobiota bacterium]
MKWQPLFAERTTQMRRSTVRELLKVTAQPGMISFAGGIPAPELFPVPEVAQAAANVLQRRGEQALQYGETEGVAELRDWIAARFSRAHFQVRPENVMIVTGSQQALDLIGKVFLNAGDRVLVENPTYLAMLSAWRPMMPAFVPLPSDTDGLCVDALSPLLRAGAKLIYLVPNFQNPQGITLSLPRRRQLLECINGRRLVPSDVAQTFLSAGSGDIPVPCSKLLATGKRATTSHKPQTIIIEDNPYGELRYSGDPLPHLLELDAANGAGGELETCVIHLGTFSKVLIPGLRVGWVIAPAEVIDKLVQAKQAADLHTSTLCQHVILELIRNGVLERQIPRLREAYGLRRDTMLSALAAHFPDGTTWTRPDGGMFLLVTLPPHIEIGFLLKRALARNVAFVPGDDFHLDGQGRNTLRLNFSNATPERIEEGVKRLGGVLVEMLRTG